MPSATCRGGVERGGRGDGVRNYNAVPRGDEHGGDREVTRLVDAGVGAARESVPAVFSSASVTVRPENVMSPVTLVRPNGRPRRSAADRGGATVGRGTGAGVGVSAAAHTGACRAGADSWAADRVVGPCGLAEASSEGIDGWRVG